MEVVYAKWSTQVTTPDGGRHNVTGGQHWPAEDPVVKAAVGGLFSPDPRWGLQTHNNMLPPELAEPPVEQATAGPGEKRNVRRG